MPKPKKRPTIADVVYRDETYFIEDREDGCDCISQMSRCHSDPRVLYNQLVRMGVALDGEIVEEEE